MNWKSEAIDRLGRYNAMAQSLEIIPEELTRLKQDAVALQSCRADKIRTSHSPGANEDRLIANFIQRDELSHSYKNAKMWMNSTNKALSILTQEEHMILQRMYISPERGVVQHLCDELGIEQSSVYRKRDQALYRFTMALYGAA